MQTESIKHLMAALGEAQKEFPKVKKDSKNPHFNSRYTSLEGAMEALEPILQKHNLVITQPASGNGIGTGCKTVMCHTTSGEVLEETLLLPSNAPGKDGANAQSGAAAITYARRIGYLSITGVAQADDDGNSAVGKPSTKQTIKADKKAPAAATSASKSKTSESAKADIEAVTKPPAAEIPGGLSGSPKEPSVFPTPEEFEKFKGRAGIIKGSLETAGLEKPGQTLAKYVMAKAGVEGLASITKLQWEAILKPLEQLIYVPATVRDAVKMVREGAANV